MYLVCVCFAINIYLIVLFGSNQQFVIPNNVVVVVRMACHQDMHQIWMMNRMTITQVLLHLFPPTPPQTTQTV